MTLDHAVSGRPVLITGCSSGIGRCLASGLRARGYPVIASARAIEDVTQLEHEGFASVKLDLADPGSVRAGFEQALVYTGGRLFALINNGAYGQPGAVEDLSRDTLRTQFETNVFGTHELTTLAIPVMRRHNGGRIVQISSILGLLSFAYRGAYNSSKYALEALTDAMRLELAEANIKLVLIEPGAIHTRFRANAHTRFKLAVDAERSVHRDTYRALEKRLAGESSGPFSLPPEAVLDKVILALERPHPRPRYRVTRSAQFLAILKRLLPDRWLDRVILRIGA